MTTNTNETNERNEANKMQSIKAQYDQDGFVLIPGFLNKTEIAQVNAEMKAFIEKTIAAMPPGFVFYEDKNNPETLKQLQDIHAYSAFFNDVLNKSRFEELACFILGEKAIGKNLEYFNKPPLVGKPTPPHQDAYYFMLTPPSAITMWLALEDVDESNGCIRYIQGSHRGVMRPHGRTQTLGFSQAIQDFGAADIEKEVAIPAKPGDLLIHHAMTIHRAEGNASQRSRRALGFIYFGESAKEDLDAKKRYQEKVMAERTAAEKDQ